jgi:hypothetical protein
MRKYLLLILIVITIFLPAAAAQTVSFTNTNYLGEEEIELRIFYGNGTYAGALNTSDPILLDGDMDYIIFMDQKQMNVLERPGVWLEWLVSRNAMNFFTILIIIGMVITVLGFSWRRGKRGSGK